MKSLVKLNNALNLRKSKYIQRWKGKDGKWKYEYPRDKKDREKKSDRLIKRLGVREDMISNLDYEKCYVYNKEGDIIFRKSGEKDYISFSDKELLKMKGAEVFTHNHPVPGTSFSPDDLAIAFLTKFKEIRAVGQKYVYSAKISSNWTGETWNNFVDAMSEVHDETMQVTRQLIKSGFITKKNAEENFFHDMWTELSKTNKGFEYKRIERTK